MLNEKKENICTTPKDISEAVKNGADYICIEGDIKNGAFRIMAVGDVAWFVCEASLAIAIALIVTGAAATTVAPPAGASCLTAGFAAPAAATSVLGSATITALSIGVCAGGIGALSTLKNKYRIVERGDDFLKLRRNG